MHCVSSLIPLHRRVICGFCRRAASNRGLCDHERALVASASAMDAEVVVDEKYLNEIETVEDCDAETDVSVEG